MISITKNSNQNQLQQVEMRLCHVHFHHNLQYHMVNCACVLHHFMKLLKMSLALHMWRPLHTLLVLLLNIKWPRDLNLYSKSIVFLRIVAWHMRVFSRLLKVWVYLRDAAMLSEMMKKCISVPNFETSSHQNVTANKPIGNMYFMYVVMAWFKSL